jgi:uncharacterized protein YceH (UPF0502 family)
VLPKAAGTKEPRWAHLFSGEPQFAGSDESIRNRSGASDRIAELETEMIALRQRIDEIEQQWQRFKQQFE